MKKNSKLHIIRIEVIDLLNSREFTETGATLKFRIDQSASTVKLNSQFRKNNLTIYDAMKIVLEIIENSLNYDLFSDNTINSDLLKNIIPKQKLSPVKFEIINEKINIVNQINSVESRDSDNTKNARDSLIQSGRGIIEALEKSNCDRRIVDSLLQIQTEILNETNIIHLGLMRITVERICSGAGPELPEALVGAIAGHLTGIGMYVAQFPEWQRFSENAALSEFDSTDIANINYSASQILKEIESNPSISTPEVPKTLKSLNSLISNPKEYSKRSIFAVMRTIENLVAKIYQYIADFKSKTLDKTSDNLSDKSSNVLVALIFGIALNAVINLDGVISKFSEASWMKTATEIISKKFKEF